MNLEDLDYAVTKIVAWGIQATDFYIKGRNTYTLTFTAPRGDYDSIDQMCVAESWTFHSSMDQGRKLERFHIHLDGRTFSDE